MVISKKRQRVYNIGFYLLPHTQNEVSFASKQMTVLEPEEEEKLYDQDEQRTDDIAGTCGWRKKARVG